MSEEVRFAPWTPATTAVARTGPFVPAKPLAVNVSHASRGKTTRHLAIALRVVVVLFDTSTMRGRPLVASTWVSVFEVAVRVMARCRATVRQLRDSIATYASRRLQEQGVLCVNNNAIRTLLRVVYGP